MEDIPEFCIKLLYFNGEEHSTVFSCIPTEMDSQNLSLGVMESHDGSLGGENIAQYFVFSLQQNHLS